MTGNWNFAGSSEADTERLGRALAGVLPPRCTIALVGPLGAGKTRLVQAVAAAAGADRRDVVSPTFVLVHEYAARLPIAHFDAYRLRDEDEFAQLGADEYFANPGWVFVEWADRVERCMPRDQLKITIHVGTGEQRQFEFEADSPEGVAIVQQLAATLGDKSSN